MNDKALKVEPRVIAIDEKLQELSNQAASELTNINHKELKKLQKEYLKRMTATYETAEL